MAIQENEYVMTESKPAPFPIICVQAMRPYQWTKNLLVLAALLFAGEMVNVNQIGVGLSALVAFCLAASATYIFNDLLDIESDREHPKKRLRPLASGALSVTAAWVLLTTLFAAALVLAYFIRLQFLYALLTILLACLSLSWLIRKTADTHYKTNLLCFGVSGTLTLAFSFLNLFPREAFFVTGIVYLSLFSTLYTVGIGSFMVWLTTKPIQDWRTRLQLETILLSAFFLLIIFLKLYFYSNDSGDLRGTHGRYFCACLGFLLLGWILPGISRRSPCIVFALPVTVLMASAEVWLWLSEIIPFFELR